MINIKEYVDGYSKKLSKRIRVEDKNAKFRDQVASYLVDNLGSASFNLVRDILNAEASYSRTAHVNISNFHLLIEYLLNIDGREGDSLGILRRVIRNNFDLDMTLLSSLRLDNDRRECLINIIDEQQSYDRKVVDKDLAFIRSIFEKTKDRSGSPFVIEKALSFDFNETNWTKSPLGRGLTMPHIAIGDVHGCVDELRALHKMIEKIANDSDKPLTVVHLGDYIDRGSKSKEVLSFLEGLSENDKYKNIFLAGNHDQFLVELVRPELDSDLDRYFVNNWYENGGISTMKSLEVEGYGQLMDSGNIQELSSRIRQSLGKKVCDFLLDLDTYYQDEGFVFTHAGIRPGIRMDEQDFLDLVTIRQPFLSSGDDWPHDFTVVHGHSMSKPSVYPHRIGVDAGAYSNGMLCAAHIHSEKIQFIGVTKDSSLDWAGAFDVPEQDLFWGTPNKIQG